MASQCALVSAFESVLRSKEESNLSDVRDLRNGGCFRAYGAYDPEVDCFLAALWGAKEDVFGVYLRNYVCARCGIEKLEPEEAQLFRCERWSSRKADELWDGAMDSGVGRNMA